MSETKKHLSGAEKRKKKENVNNFVLKLPKITGFFEKVTSTLDNKSGDTTLMRK